MKILKIRFRNFNIYGNKWQEIDLNEINNSFCLVLGKSGDGKSTISDVIKFGLYGKVDKKRLRDIVNRHNKNCQVEITIEAAGALVYVERGLEPGYFNVSVNGQPMVDIAGKGNLQDYLETEYLKIPFHIFNNTLSLSINDFKSFLKMTPSDKRQIIDRVFGMSVINQMSDLLKNDIKKEKEVDMQLSIKNKLIVNDIEKTENGIEEILERISVNKENQRLELITSISETQQLRETVQTTCLEKKFSLDDVDKDLKLEEKEIKHHESRLSHLKEKIKLYQNSQCPVCESSLTGETHQHLHDGYVLEKAETEDLIKKKQERLVRFKQTQRNLKTEIDELEHKRMHLDFDLKSKTSRLKDFDRAKSEDDQIYMLRIFLEKSRTELEENIKSKTKLEKRASVYKILDDLLGEKGVKQTILKMIIPGLNHQINLLLKEMNLNYTVGFDEEWNARILTSGFEISVDTLSTGEGKRIDLAILVAIIRLMKLKFSGLNLLFLDEIFSSLDSDSIHHVLGILQRFGRELKINIFVVNHAPLDTPMFDYKIEVNRQMGFSNLSVEKVV